MVDNIFDEIDIQDICEIVEIEPEEMKTIEFHLDFRQCTGYAVCCDRFIRYIKTMFPDRIDFKFSTDRFIRAWIDFPVKKVSKDDMRLVLREICRIKLPDGRRIIDYLDTCNSESVTYPGIFANYCHGLSFKANKFLDELYKATV